MEQNYASEIVKDVSFGKEAKNKVEQIEKDEKK